MGMDTVAITALILSILAILLWAFTFIFPKQTMNFVGTVVRPNPEEKAPKEKETESSLAVPENRKSPVASGSSPDQADKESQFMSETQKFSLMVQKNLEMLNNRVGVKFSVKPLSEHYSAKKKGPDFVDSMDVSEDENDRMLTDESEGKN